MTDRRTALITAAIGLGAAAPDAAAQAGLAAPTQAPYEGPTFAVELRTGAKWDAAKPPQDQALFREHSAHLRRLREEGRLLIGARYGEKGLLIVRAEDEAAARQKIEQDPAIAAQVFAYELHPFAVFYSGCVAAARRRG
jgi:uncharacterized protein YciI